MAHVETPEADIHRQIRPGDNAGLSDSIEMVSTDVFTAMLQPILHFQHAPRPGLPTPVTPVIPPIPPIPPTRFQPNQPAISISAPAALENLTDHESQISKAI